MNYVNNILEFSFSKGLSGKTDLPFLSVCAQVRTEKDFSGCESCGVTPGRCKKDKLSCAIYLFITAAASWQT